MSDNWFIVKSAPNAYEPKIEYIPDQLCIKFNPKYNWRISCDVEYRKKIIPDFVKHYKIKDGYKYSNCYLDDCYIIIDDISKIATESKQTIEQIAETIKTNLIANVIPPEEVSSEFSEFMNEVRLILICLAFGIGFGLTYYITHR